VGGGVNEYSINSRVAEASEKEGSVPTIRREGGATSRKVSLCIVSDHKKHFRGKGSGDLELFL